MKVKARGYIIPEKPGEPWKKVESWEEVDDDKVGRFSYACQHCKGTYYPKCIDQCPAIVFKPKVEDFRIPGYNC